MAFTVAPDPRNAAAMKKLIANANADAADRHRSGKREPNEHHWIFFSA